jgi:hypothetical protein
MTILSIGYATKKALKASTGKRLRYLETSFFGSEYKPNGTFMVTGKNRSWFAAVTMADGLIYKVA